MFDVYGISKQYNVSTYCFFCFYRDKIEPAEVELNQEMNGSEDSNR